MKIDANLNDSTLLQLIGQRLAQSRLALNLTQQQLADQAGLGLRTVQRLESGAVATQLSGFLRVCRVLGLIEGLDALLPPVASSPMAQLKQQHSGQRKRASGVTANRSGDEWTWGDAK